MLLNAGFSVARMHWYAWDDSSQGALALTNAQALPTQAAIAYANVEDWLRGAQINGCSATAEGLWTCQLVRAGAPAWVVWSTTGTVSVSSFGASTETDIAGIVTQLEGAASVEAGASPVLLQ